MPALARKCAAFALVAGLTAAGCGKRVSRAPTVPGGDAERGKVALRGYGCGSCHTIPGIRGARGLVGPPLADVGRRIYIAGVLPNEPMNMIQWIMDPPRVDSKTAMPNLGVTERDARDMAEYLYRLPSRTK
jgi:cytochrome c